MYINRYISVSNIIFFKYYSSLSFMAYTMQRVLKYYISGFTECSPADRCTKVGGVCSRLCSEGKVVQGLCDDDGCQCCIPDRELHYQVSIFFLFFCIVFLSLVYQFIILTFML